MGDWTEDPDFGSDFVARVHRRRNDAAIEGRLRADNADLRARLDNPGPCPLCEQSKHEAAIAEENSRNYLKHAERVSGENDDLRVRLAALERERDEARQWFAALQKAIVGETGASAILTVEKMYDTIAAQSAALAAIHKIMGGV